MPIAQGTVEAVSSKVLPEPDQFGNTYRHSLKLNGEWFSLKPNKSDTINIKHNGSWMQLGKGASVKVTYEKNGTFNNTSSTNIKVVEGATKNASSAPAAEPVKVATGVDDNVQTRIQAGQATNLALEALKFTDGNVADAKKILEAVPAVAPTALNALIAVLAGETSIGVDTVEEDEDIDADTIPEED